jgi:hypothetical protein
MTARSHETIRVGLRRIIRDKNVDAKALIEAVKLFMRLEGLVDEKGRLVDEKGRLVDEKGRVVPPKNQPAIHHVSPANDKVLQELIELANREKTE